VKTAQVLGDLEVYSTDKYVSYLVFRNLGDYLRISVQRWHHMPSNVKLLVVYHVLWNS
jgi:hypothetical protein